MNRKAFDILPPRKVNLFYKKEKPLKENKFSKFKLGKARFFIYIFILLFFIGVFYNFAFQKVTIELWPKKEKLFFETSLIVNSNLEEIESLDGLAIIGRIFEEKITVSRVFYSTGVISKDEKTEGIIRVYNNYNTSSQVLVATTRFVSTEGKLFRLSEKSIIPGKHYEGGKLVSGYLDVKVVADQAGSEYNIGPSSFSIPGFAGDARYTYFYAESFQSMSGGAKRDIQIVTSADLTNARDFLIKEAKRKGIISLKNKIPEKYAFSEELLQQEVIDSSTLIKVGTEIDKFDSQVEINTKALLFGKEKIEEFGKKFTFSNSIDGKLFHEPSFKLNYSVETIDLDIENIELSLETEIEVYSDMERLLVRSNFTQKNLQQIKNSLTSFNEIDRFSIKVSPFWLIKTPKDINKIELSLNLD